MQPSALLATLGTEPQVVTLLLDALLDRKIPIKRVVVLHTNPSNPPIGKALRRLDDEFLEKRTYAGQLRYVPEALTSDEGVIEDISTPDEVDDAYTQTYQVLRRLKREQFQIHLSIAGGRKTMSMLAMAAAQQLFDHDDYLWHVISPQHLVDSRELHADQPSDIQLVRIPIQSWGSPAVYENSEERERVLNAVSQLTDREREITKMIVNEGLTTAEVAAELGIKPKTVTQHLYNAYPKLEEHLESGVINRMTMIAKLGKYSHII